MLYLKRTLVAFVIAGMIPASSTAAQRFHDKQSCSKLFTLSQFDRAARATYHDTRTPPAGAYGRLWRYARCQRPPSTEARARAHWARELRAWETRRHPFSEAVASVFDDSGATASGFHAQLGFASLFLPFGARVEFCYSTCVVGIMEDHGPYVGGRTFDLNFALERAIGMPFGVETVRYRVL